MSLSAFSSARFLGSASGAKGQDRRIRKERAAGFVVGLYRPPTSRRQLPTFPKIYVDTLVTAPCKRAVKVETAAATGLRAH
jgi:hypothetical protein